ncbi:MAG: tetratricopeptide repeat protein, partial [Rhodovibrionaceae bacterium]
QAAYWHWQAAEQNHASARFVLGYLYFEGRGVEPDGARALALIRSAAEQSVAEAQFVMGRLYATGTLVPRDEDAAIRWFRAAEAQGYPQARGLADELEKTQ